MTLKMSADPRRPEQRKARRFPVHCPVEFAQGQAVSGHGVSRDISAQGLYLLTEQPLQLHEVVHLTVRPRCSPSFRCTARVVRIESCPPDLGVAVEFAHCRFEGRTAPGSTPAGL